MTASFDCHYSLNLNGSYSHWVLCKPGEVKLFSTGQWTVVSQGASYEGESCDRNRWCERDWACHSGDARATGRELRDCRPGRFRWKTSRGDTSRSWSRLSLRCDKCF